MFMRVLACLCTIFVFSTPAHARHIKLWSFDKLSKSADVVVIATVISSEAFDEPSGKPELGDAVFEGRLTRFVIKGVLNGEVEGRELELVHYIVTANGRFIAPGIGHAFSTPHVAEFSGGRLAGSIKKGATKSGEDAAPTHYLLFLKQRKDGKFEPVSGQVDSACSVMLVKPEAPAPFHRDQTSLRDMPSP